MGSGRVPTTHEAIVSFGDAEAEVIGTLAVETHGSVVAIYQLRTWSERGLLIKNRPLIAHMRQSAIMEHVLEVMRRHPNLTSLDINIRRPE